MAAVLAILAVTAALSLPSASGARGMLLAACGVLIVSLPGALVAWSMRPVDSELPTIELVLGASGVAVGVLVIGGLALNLLPFGVMRWSWLGLCFGVLLVAWALAPDRVSQEWRNRPALPRIGPTAMLAGAGALVVVAVILARAGAEQGRDAFSQLWMVRDSGGASTAHLGIENHEGAATTYRLVVSLDGEAVETWDSIDLREGERWNGAVPADIPPGSTLIARLYLASNPDLPYRETRLTGVAS